MCSVVLAPSMHPNALSAPSLVLKKHNKDVEDPNYLRHAVKDARSGVVRLEGDVRSWDDPQHCGPDSAPFRALFAGIE